MAVNLEKQTMSLNKVVARDSSVIWIEQDILVPDTKPDVMKIVQVEAVPFVANTEVADGSIRVTGEITYYIIYRAMDQDKTRGISMTYPFTQSINVKEAKKGMNAKVLANVRNIIYSLPNERKVSIKTELVFKYVITETDNIELIQSIKDSEDIEALKAQDTFYNVIDVKQEVIDAKEDIVIPETTPQIGEILRVSTNISNTDYKVSYNKILVKGDINIEMLYLETGDTNNVFTYETMIPFTGMIEFPNIAETSRFDITYSLRNLEITTGENNLLTISGEVTVDAIMFEEKQVSYVNDFYSTKSNLDFSTQDVAVIKNKESLVKQVTLKDNIGSTQDRNKVVSYKIDTEHLVSKVTGNTLYIDGPLKVAVTFTNMDTGIIDAKTYDMLVDTSIALNKEVEDKNVDVSYKILNSTVIAQAGTVEANVTLDITANIENIDKITIIGEIDESSLDENNFSSMYVYIVKKGDNLWSIAKKYKTTVDKIANTNNITDENKLDIGQKILIIR